LVVSCSHLLYGYINYSYKAELIYLADDIVTKNFAENLYKYTPEEIASTGSFSGVSAQYIDKERLLSEVIDSYLMKKTNRLLTHIPNAIKNKNYTDPELLKVFPEIEDSGLIKIPGILTADQHDRKPEPLNPWFPEWDKVFQGLSKNDLIMVFALTGVGKSSFSGMCIAESLKSKKKVAIYQTEMTTEAYLQNICGSILGYRPDEALYYFSVNPHVYDLVKRKIGKYLVIPDDEMFSWRTAEKMLGTDPEIFVLDQVNQAIASEGKPICEETVANFTSKLWSYQKKSSIPFMFVHQEGHRPPTRKETDEKPHIMSYGTGQPHYSQQAKHYCSLMINIRKTDSDERIITCVGKDRFRGIADAMEWSASLDKAGKLKGYYSRRINPTMNLLTEEVVSEKLEKLGF
jgi:Txe/YoeB family toxin of Txe-Axe toxin-antitoxin module